MCFQIDSHFSKRRRVKEHLLCYKEAALREDCCISPYRNAVYHYGLIYKNIIELPDINGTICIGLHSFTREWLSVLGFLHAVIPKGAQYYRNSNFGEYISNALIVFRSKRSMDVWLKRNKNKSLSDFKTHKLERNA